MLPSRDDAFFVGYLPTPPRLRTFLRVTAASMLLLIVGLGIALAARQDDPGSARWDLSKEVAFEGTIRATPYPALQTQNTTWLIVSEGKRGAAMRVADLDGRRVRARGSMLTRDGRNMLELVSRSDAITSLNEPALPRPDAISTGELVTLTGEIVDSKCFLGAMKPGEGKTHKACAALCIRGGVPPILVTWTKSGATDTYLLTDESGASLQGEALEAILPFVGDPVQVQGQLAHSDGLPIIRLDNRSIRRR